MNKKHYVVDLQYRMNNGNEVELFGWVKATRKHNHNIFIDVTDSTGTIQAVVNRDSVGAEVFESADKVTVESAVKVCGTLAPTGKPEPNLHEIQATCFENISPASMHISPQPRSNFDIFDPRLQEQLLSKRHFYLRNEKIAAILRFRHELMGIVHNWFRQQRFVEIHAPILTPSPLYDDRTPMGICVHGQNVFLTQCVGFYLEQAVHSFEKIYNIGPSFRAEESRSKRHLMEYWHIKAEVAFTDFEALIQTVEQLIQHVTEMSMAFGAEAAETLGVEICQHGLRTPFPRIDYMEAIKWLTDQGADIEAGKSLGSEEEALLSTKFPDTPFWIVGIPRSIEPFPYVIDEQDSSRTVTADLIASDGYGELLGVAEKIHSLEMLDERMKEKGKDGDPRYDWLRDLRRYGCVPHGGFGMGVERLIRWLLHIPHVRDTIPFHRAFGRQIHP